MNLSLNVDDLIAELDCAVAPARRLAPSWNVPPTSELYIVADRKPSGAKADAEDDGVTRRLEIARWGLVPGWAKDPSVGARMFNARSETIAEKPAYRAAFAKRRCVIPAAGYYEWQKISGAKKKQPYFIHARADEPLLFAGVFEFWKDRSKPDDDPDRWLVSASVVTAAAEKGLAEIHDRMPVVMMRDDVDEWLDPGCGTDAAGDLLGRQIAAEPDRLTWHPVSADVGSVAVNRPDLADPVAVEPPGPAG
ncbi:SOS response-associated peptidase [Spelaeicoccus albus]